MENTRTNLNYSDEDIIRYAAEVRSMAKLLEKLGLRVAGGNYSQMRKRLHQLGLECEHWTGQGWNKNERLKDWSEYTRTNRFKKHLIDERGHQCESCGLRDWKEEPIPLEVDHVDGDRTNNNPSNLRLLCCNCHALTPTWRGRANKGHPVQKLYKKKRPDKKPFEHPLSNMDVEKMTSKLKKMSVSKLASELGVTTKMLRTFCKKNGIEVPRKRKFDVTREELINLLNAHPLTQIGRMFGVSDNAIRKRCCSLGIQALHCKAFIV